MNVNIEQVKKEEQELFQRVLKSVADELELFAAGEFRQCPECGKVLPASSLTLYGDEEDRDFEGEELEEGQARCPYCFEASDLDDFETTLEDYYNGNVLDVHLIVDGGQGRGNYQIDGSNFIGCRIHLHGYPSTWVDTYEQAVIIREAEHQLRYYITRQACYMLEEWVASMSGICL